MLDLNQQTLDINDNGKAPEFRYKNGYWWSRKKSQKLNTTDLAALLSIFLLSSCLCFIIVDSISSETASIKPNNLETHSFKAIRTLHAKLDDDDDGEVDDRESKSFLESDEIKVDNNNAGAYSIAHKLRYLHQDGKDRSISVDELWEAWKSSQVHNWTIDETVYWLVNYVELPEYSQLFEQHSINGTLLPRLAADSHYLSKLGITDPSAKSKISIKAMDVVLFGPPKLGNGKRALQALQENLESLQKAEDQMLELQHEKAIKALEEVTEKKNNLEHQLELQRQFSASNLSDNSEHNSNKQHPTSNGGNIDISREIERNIYVAKLENEVKSLREELQKTYDSMAANKFRAPFPLRTLLQTTYNIESRCYNQKKLSLESKAKEVKLRNQKLQKKKNSFLGYYKMAQENSLEEDINIIVEVKEAIMQVTKEMKEVTERWRTIEELCGFSLDLTSSSRSL